MGKSCWLVILVLLLTPVVAPAATGKLYLVSVGPGDPKYLTLQAIDTIKQADLVLADKFSGAMVKEYLQGKKVENPWDTLWWHQGKVWMKELESFPPEERPKIVKEKMRQRDEYVKKLQNLVARGQKIALLDGGDPTIYPRGFWLLEGFPEEQVEIVPGIGALTASFAALKRTSTGAGARFVALTAPYGFFGREEPEDLARDLGRYNGTLVFYMALTQLPRLVEVLKKYQPADLPVAVVYYAGYPDKEKVVRGTLGDIVAKTANEPEKWLGMIIVGRCLTGPAFRLVE